MPSTNSASSMISEHSTACYMSTGALITNISITDPLPVFLKTNGLRAWSYISTPITTNVWELIKSNTSLSVTMALTLVSEECTAWWTAWSCPKCQPENQNFLPHCRQRGMHHPSAAAVFSKCPQSRPDQWHHLSEDRWKMVLSMLCDRSVFKKSDRMASVPPSGCRSCHNSFPKGLWKQEGTRSTLTAGPNIPPLHSAGFWIPWM